MSMVNIRKALEKRLIGMPGVISTVHENTDYNPTLGTPYQKVDFLPAPTNNLTFGSTEVAYESGLLQVVLHYPIGAGPGAAATMAESIRSRFPRGLTLTEGGVQVLINRTPSVGPALPPMDEWYRIPVSIYFFSHVFR